MTGKRPFTDQSIAALKPDKKRRTYRDPGQRHLYVIVQPTGAKSFYFIANDPSGEPVRDTFGTTDEITLDEARAMAQEAFRNIRQPAVLMSRELR